MLYSLIFADTIQISDNCCVFVERHFKYISASNAGEYIGTDNINWERIVYIHFDKLSFYVHKKYMAQKVYNNMVHLLYR